MSKKLPTHPGVSMIPVDDYNTGIPIPNTCCNRVVAYKTITVAVHDTNLAVPERLAHLVDWQCMMIEEHTGKWIFLSDGSLLDEGNVSHGLGQE